MKQWSALEKLIWVFHRIKGGASAIIETITGALPLVLQNAIPHAIVSLTRYGLCVQNGTPTPDASVDIMCNNGPLRYGALGRNLLDPSAANTVLEYYINKTDGEVKPSPLNFMFANYMPVEAGKTYVAYGRRKSDNDLSDYNRVAWYDSSKNWISGADYTQNRIAVVTAPANAAYARFSCNPTGATTVTQALVDSYNWTFCEGNAEITPFVPFEGGIYTDGTDEVLTVKGINLFDKNTMDTGQGYYVNNSGNIVNGYNANRTVWIPCKPNTKYSYWHTEGAGGCRAFAMNKDTIDTSDSSEWLKGSPASLGKNVVSTVTTPADAVKLYITAARSNLDPERTFDEQLADFMVVEGEVSEATAYEPYHAPQTAPVPMLLSVGDYKDEVELISGIKTGKVGVKMLDGVTNGRKFGAAWNSVYKRGNLSISDMLSSASSVADALCTHFGYSSSVYSSPANDGFCTNNGMAYFSFVEDTDINSATDANAYLAAQYAANTPVIVVYPLADETTEQTTAQHLVTHEGTNIVDSVANVGPVEAEVKYMTASAQDVLSTLLGMRVTPKDISKQDAEDMIDIITGEDNK